MSEEKAKVSEEEVTKKPVTDDNGKKEDTDNNSPKTEVKKESDKDSKGDTKNDAKTEIKETKKEKKEEKHIDYNCEVIVITSGKGGVGKTTTTANIGTGLAKLNKKVVLIDTDIGLRNLDVVMGLENRIVYNLVDVVEGNCRYKQALIKDKQYPNLFLLPSAQTKDKTSVTPEQMKKLVEDLKKEFDYIILDCPAGIEQGFKNAIAAADRALIVTTPEVSAIRDADRIIGLLEANEIKRTDLIVNRIRMDMVKRGEMMSIEDVVEILAIDLIGAVPDDENIVISTNQGQPLVGDNSLAGRAYMNICRRVLGEEVEYLDLNDSGFFKKLSRIFKKSN